MCGLLGLIARTNSGFLHGDLQAFEQMLVVNTVRGADSVGAFTKFGNGDVRAIKHGGNPFNLLRTSEWREYRQAVIHRGKFLVGHNRKATMGEINTDNAHPFVEDHIALVHNGTLRSQNNLTKRQTVVDSNAIAHALAEEEGDPRKVLDRIDGAFALIWYNAKEDKLYAARNEERTLVLIESDRHWVLASETWIAAYPMSRNNLEVKNVTVIKHNELYEFGRGGEFKVSEFNNQRPTWKGTQYDYGRNSRDFTCEGGDCGDDVPPFLAGSKATPEIKSLHQALATAREKKQMKQVETTKPSSTVCALTQPNGRGTAGPTETMCPDEVAENGRLSTLHKTSEEFPRDLLLTCKIVQMRVMNNSRIKWMGKCTTPGKEMVDAAGFLPDDVLVSEQERWYDVPIVGKVQWVTDTVNGGLTVHLKETRKATMTQTHNASSPIMYWDYALNECTCKECKRKVEPWEGVFTAIRMKGMIGATKSGYPVNIVEMTCPDCLLKKVPSGQYHDDFEKKYNLAKNAIYSARAARLKAAESAHNSTVQDRQPVGSVLSQRDAEILRLPSPTTLQ